MKKPAEPTEEQLDGLDRRPLSYGSVDPVAALATPPSVLPNIKA